jgi:PiT family inorganic phosphate transporter
METAVIVVGLVLAFANGANDNFKGVATLFGSGTASFRRALTWASVTTLAGSLTAYSLAGGLLAAFSGKGLVPQEFVVDSRFPLAVVVAAALTVMLATRLGFPVSTTHALTGGLVGAGWVAASGDINLSSLNGGFVFPLFASPLIATWAALGLYPAFALARRRLGVEHDSCACVRAAEIVPVASAPVAAVATIEAPAAVIFTGSEASCAVGYRGAVLGIRAGTVLDAAHYLSAGAVGFARGLNDTPKIAALLLLGGALSTPAAVASVSVAMVVGGLFAGRRVAETMSHRITGMNAGQGFTANIVTSAIVIGASRLGLPVSTTHVSAGALFGIGAVTRRAYWKTIMEILMAWVITLPVSAGLGALAMALMAR